MNSNARLNECSTRFLIRLLNSRLVAVDRNLIVEILAERKTPPVHSEIGPLEPQSEVNRTSKKGRKLKNASNNA